MIGKSVIFVGINAAGITSKIESFDKVLFDLKPTIWMMQETKRGNSQASLKSKNLQNYQIFELNRQKTKQEGGKGLRGGGLAIGALHDVKPVLLRQGDDDCECMSIQVQIGKVPILCVAGYGPQACDSSERKQNFWNFLDQEVQYARDNEIGIVIEIDSNAWAGNHLIPNDPNLQNGNGKLLENFLQRNSNVVIVNSLSICSGLITRKRKTEIRQETSVLDLFLVCDRILPLVVKMNVDEKGIHQLSNFSGIQHNSKVTESDHAIVEMHIDIEFPAIKPTRKEFFNYKKPEGQSRFVNLTSNSRKLSACFENELTFREQFKIWQHTLNRYIVQSFPKIRTRIRKFSETECGKLFEVRKRLKLELQENDNPNTFNKLNQVEKDIAHKIDKQFLINVQEKLGHLTGDEGAISTNGLWAAKNSLIPKHKPRNSIAVRDSKGNLITSPEGIKKFCLDEVLTRLRHRKMHPDLLELQKLKELLCKKRLELARHKKSKHFTMKEMEKALQH